MKSGTVMDLVVGATGILGGAICRLLREKGRPVRALVRETSDPAKLAALVEAGVETVVGDLKDPASLRDACRDVGAVLSTASSTLSRTDGDSIDSVDLQGQTALVAAARDAGVGHVVYVSFPPDPAGFPLQDAKRAVEDRIRSSGLPWTILHPTHFREVWLGPALGFDPAQGRARVFGEGLGPIRWVAVADVAAAAVAALDNPQALGRTFELGGPESLSLAEVIDRMEALSGTRLERDVVPLENLHAMLSGEDPLLRSFAALMLACARHGCAIDSTEAERVLGFRPSPLSDHLRGLV
ncbi:NADH dehydrogenase [Azospirillum lipoferum]|nr:NADH dehydrogenase [Azospirillum lipoferum]